MAISWAGLRLTGGAWRVGLCREPLLLVEIPPRHDDISAASCRHEVRHPAVTPADLDLTLEPAGLIAPRHDQRRDHFVRPSPPPQSCGLGGRSRLRSSSLPLDPIRGILSPVSAI
ncbi:hypothetical protein [Bradyrhizobium japonicum]|uniref:hypothetical protein n=1 Tax=Bradyrhizobium japonicum TaxID=375 RepID=UPI001B8A6155|nr:hypothetical protein [Bradyrhizobium japonicum]MBR0974030.1 hypothetical protein [Bradyrhizobium japonicum]